jgi:hypothetical protein
MKGDEQASISKGEFTPCLIIQVSLFYDAMTRLIVILVAIVWASLLLISWSGSTEIPAESGEVIAQQ